jgi:hypothetical protein
LWHYAYLQSYQAIVDLIQDELLFYQKLEKRTLILKQELQNNHKLAKDVYEQIEDNRILSLAGNYQIDEIETMITKFVSPEMEIELEKPEQSKKENYKAN